MAKEGMHVLYMMLQAKCDVMDDIECLGGRVADIIAFVVDFLTWMYGWVGMCCVCRW